MTEWEEYLMSVEKILTEDGFEEFRQKFLNELIKAIKQESEDK